MLLASQENHAVVTTLPRKLVERGHYRALQQYSMSALLCLDQ
jgi:hypothetical protein